MNRDSAPSSRVESSGPPPLRDQPPSRYVDESSQRRWILAGAVGALLLLLVILMAMLAARGDRAMGTAPGAGDGGTGGMGTSSGVGDADAEGHGRKAEATPAETGKSEVASNPTGAASETNTDEESTQKPSNADVTSPIADAETPPVADTTKSDGTPGDSTPPADEPTVSGEKSPPLRSFGTFSPPARGDNRLPMNEILKGRQAPSRQGLLDRYGGGEDTEAAVRLALEWLVRNQLENGAWSLQKPYSDAGSVRSDLAATAMALLAFEGAGHTPAEGIYKANVRRGVHALLEMQGRDGSLGSRGRDGGQLYAQAQATIAICELYGLTKSHTYRPPAQQAVDYAVQIQSDAGGWRYEPGNDADMSVTGWFVMALQSGLMAELNVPSETLLKVEAFLDSVACEGGSQYAYHATGLAPRISMTAEGLLCRQYLGWHRSDQRLIDGIKYISQEDLDWQRGNVYSWYYITQVMHNMEGSSWTQWNNRLKPVLLANQITTGDEAGSWAPGSDTYGRVAGRLYTTCLCVWMLETYYRHLPIYSYRIP